ncbi:unnamed protein product, partial [Vitis vinifera]|uniref:Uncharacterized protein n=1 Tax=Vitis vinifera TaxID=29760 RepID=D7TEP9_VITVI
MKGDHQHFGHRLRNSLVASVTQVLHLCLRHRPSIELGHRHCLGLVQLRQIRIQLVELWRRGGLLAHSSYY